MLKCKHSWNDKEIPNISIKMGMTIRRTPCDREEEAQKCKNIIDLEGLRARALNWRLYKPECDSTCLQPALPRGDSYGQHLLPPSGFYLASANAKHGRSQLSGGKLTTLDFPIMAGAALCPHRDINTC